MPKAKFSLQTSHNQGTYRNPFKSGGYGIRYSPWKTVAKFDTLEAAQEAWANWKDKGLERRRVQHYGKTVITESGRIYEVQETDYGTHVVKGLTFKGCVPGYEGNI